MKEYILKELELWISQIRTNIDREGANASGKARRSLRVNVDGNKYQIVACDYFPMLESGYDGKNPPAPRNFSTIIEQWTRDKGMTFQDEEERKDVAGRIAYFIQENGTKLHRQGGRTSIYTDVIDAQLGGFKKRLKEQFLTTISEWQKK